MITASAYAIPGIVSSIHADYITVCELIGADPEKLKSKYQGESIVRYRRMVCYLLRKLDHNVNEVGELLGIDHSTVSYHARLVAKWIKTYRDEKNKVEHYLKQLKIS